MNVLGSKAALNGNFDPVPVYSWEEFMKLSEKVPEADLDQRCARSGRLRRLCRTTTSRRSSESSHARSRACGNSWELMGIHGNLELVGSHGNLWEFMGTCGKSWELMGIHGNLWELPKPFT